MPIGSALLTLLLIVVATLALGCVLRARNGRVKRQPAADSAARLDEARHGEFTAPVTLVQYSTETCARCPGVRRVLQSIADDSHGVEARDIDLTHAPDLARELRILQTPTILIVDGDGSVRSRIAGVPTRQTIENEIATILEASRV